MLYLIFFIFSLYFVFLLIVLAGWQKAIHLPHPETDSVNIAAHLISVVVPFRNENSSLPAIIHALSVQSYREFEVIFVDDGSTDESWQIATTHLAEKPNFHLLAGSGRGKKHALTEGIGVAKGEIIVTTDADCVVPDDWLEKINLHFQGCEIKMVCGAVRMETTTTLDHLQAMEFSTVMGSGAAMLALNLPMYCNGANLAFRKAVFMEVKGYEGNLHIPSGDDEFLLNKISARYPDGILFLNDPDSVVTTFPASGLKAFIHQRLRWAGKWKFSKSPASLVCGMLMILMQIAFVGACILLLLDYQGAHTLLFLIFTKFLMEFMVVFTVSQFLKQKVRIFPFVLLQFFYPFYVLGIGIASHVSGYRWKGRRVLSNASSPGLND